MGHQRQKAGIAASNCGRFAGIGEVSDAMGRLDQVTQQNAALVEQSAAAAASLKSQAERLAQMVASFRLRQSALGPTP